MSTRTLVTFHAHPDDEALFTAGTMAKAAAAGHRVVLVVATRGEAGETGIGTLAHDESLGERRSAELLASAELLGVARVEFLGYADSGVDGAARAGAFSRADVEEAAARLAALLDEEHADVLTAYDRFGGYGHPDHVQVHHVGLRAATLAATPSVLEATFNRELLRAGSQLAGELGAALPEAFTPDDLAALEWFTPEAELTTAIDVQEFLDVKRAAMRAHTSQTSSATDDTTRTLAVIAGLPDDYFSLACGTEWFVRRGAPPGLAEDDVFAGLP